MVESQTDTDVYSSMCPYYQQIPWVGVCDYVSGVCPHVHVRLHDCVCERVHVCPSAVSWPARGAVAFSGPRVSWDRPCCLHSDDMSVLACHGDYKHPSTFQTNSPTLTSRRTKGCSRLSRGAPRSTGSIKGRVTPQANRQETVCSCCHRRDKRLFICACG